MLDKLTWAEFAEKYQPKDGDKFTDDRGNEWVKDDRTFRSAGGFSFPLAGGNLAKILTCPLIPPKAKRKLWPALIIKDSIVQTWMNHSLKRTEATAIGTSEALFENEADAKKFYGAVFHSWPAVPNADGSYEVEE